MNGLVIFPQVVSGFLYMPIASLISSSSHEQPSDFFELFKEGVYCLYGINSITRERGYDCSPIGCNSDLQWGQYCCDSCDGSLPGVSNFNSYSIILYVLFYIFYNKTMISLFPFCIILCIILFVLFSLYYFLLSFFV
jgi:hypothetical protein